MYMGIKNSFRKTYRMQVLGWRPLIGKHNFGRSPRIRTNDLVKAAGSADCFLPWPLEVYGERLCPTVDDLGLM